MRYGYYVPNKIDFQYLIGLELAYFKISDIRISQLCNYYEILLQNSTTGEKLLFTISEQEVYQNHYRLEEIIYKKIKSHISQQYAVNYSSIGITNANYIDSIQKVQNKKTESSEKVKKLISYYYTRR